MTVLRQQAATIAFKKLFIKLDLRHLHELQLVRFSPVFLKK